MDELRQKQRLGTPFLQFRIPLFRRLPACGKPNQQEARHRPQQLVPRAEPNAPVHLDAVVKHFAGDKDRQKNGHSAEQRSHQAGLRERRPQHERDDNQSPSPRCYLDIQRVKRLSRMWLHDRQIQEKEIRRQGDDSQLKEVQPSLAAGQTRKIAFIAYEQSQRHRRNVKQEEHIARPPLIEWGVQHAVVVRRQRLSQGIKRKRHAHQPPETAGVARGPQRRLEAGNHCEEHHQELDQAARDRGVKRKSDDMAAESGRGNERNFARGWHFWVDPCQWPACVRQIMNVTRGKTL